MLDSIHTMRFQNTMFGMINCVCGLLERKVFKLGASHTATIVAAMYGICVCFFLGAYADTIPFISRSSKSLWFSQRWQRMAWSNCRVCEMWICITNKAAICTHHCQLPSKWCFQIMVLAYWLLDWWYITQSTKSHRQYNADSYRGRNYVSCSCR